MEAKYKDDYEILNNVQGSIRAFDNKAGILVSVIGIVFGLSLYFLKTFEALTKIYTDELITFEIYNIRYISFGVVYGIFFLFALASIFCCLFVFYPRKNKKHAPEINVNYYWNLSNMDFKDYLRNKDTWKEDEQVIWDQIKRNSDICKRKHKCLVASIYLFGIFLVLFVLLVILHICFVR